jgi:hypothetical protein
VLKRSTALALGALALVLAPAASAADPGGWVVAGERTLPARYATGIAGDGAERLLLAGATGLWRTDLRLTETVRLDAAIPGGLDRTPGLTRLGSPSWDAAGGQWVVPLSGSSGVAALGLYDAGLSWRLGARLEGGTSARWAQVQPGTGLVWMPAGGDLVAYRLAEAVPALALPRPGAIAPAARRAGALPPGGASAATAEGGRLLLAGSGDGRLRLWSLDPADPAATPRLEAERALAGEPVGLAAVTALGGTLQVLLGPASAGGPPRLVSFVRAGDGALRLAVTRRPVRAGRPANLAVAVTQTLGGVRAPLAGVRVSAAGRSVLTDELGEATLRVRPARPGTLVVRATRGELAAPPVRLVVAPPIGIPLSGLPSARLSAGAASRRVRAVRLLDCSGQGGCETTGSVRPRTCVAARSGADVRIGLLGRPASRIDVLIQDGDRLVEGGRALAVGRDALRWRFPVRRGLPPRARITFVLVYPDETGALAVATLRRGGC